MKIERVVLLMRFILIGNMGVYGVGLVTMGRIMGLGGKQTYSNRESANHREREIQSMRREKIKSIAFWQLWGLHELCHVQNLI